jgi:pimeloyl-ACP methyl ester carboxylesterase
MPETQYASAPDGVKIAYQVTGDGELDLVLMQGAVAHLELAWEDARLSRLFDRLGAFSRLIRFDRRGMGMSDPLDQLPTFDEQVEDFGAVVDAVGSERAALMGTIDAGMLSLAFAAEHSDRTAAVIAFEAPIRFMRSDDDDLGVTPRYGQELHHLLEVLAAEGANVGSSASLQTVAMDPPARNACSHDGTRRDVRQSRPTRVPGPACRPLVSFTRGSRPWVLGEPSC